jgi:hypothetical protein
VTGKKEGKAEQFLERRDETSEEKREKSKKILN